MFAYIPRVLISLGLRTPCVSFCPHSHLFVHCPHYIPLPLMSGPREPHTSHCGWTSSFWRQDMLPASLPTFCPLNPSLVEDFPASALLTSLPDSSFFLAFIQLLLNGVSLDRPQHHAGNPRPLEVLLLGPSQGLDLSSAESPSFRGGEASDDV